MNVSRNTKAESPENAFLNRRASLALAVAALFLSSIAIPFADKLYVAYPIAFLLLFYVAFCSRRIWNILAFFLVFGLCSLFGSIAAGLVAVALYVALASGAHLTLSCKTPVFALLTSAVAFGLAALLSGGLLARALPALFPLPAYLLLSLAYARRERRSILVLSAQFGFLAVVIALAVVYFVKTYGSLDRETILSVAESFRATLFDSAKLLREELLTSFAEAELEVPAIWEKLLADDSLESVIRQLTILLPGLTALLCGLLAFFGQSLLLSVLQNEGDEFSKSSEAILLVLGIPSAVCYLAASLLLLLLNASSLPYAVAENLRLILLLPFCFSGLQRLVGLMILSPKGGRWFFLVLFLSLCCCLSVGAAELLAFYAAFDTIFTPIRAKILQSRNSSGGGEDD